MGRNFGYNIIVRNQFKRFQRWNKTSLDFKLITKEKNNKKTVVFSLEIAFVKYLPNDVIFAPILFDSDNSKLQNYSSVKFIVFLYLMSQFNFLSDISGQKNVLSLKFT